MSLPYAAPSEAPASGYPEGRQYLYAAGRRQAARRPGAVPRTCPCARHGPSPQSAIAVRNLVKRYPRSPVNAVDGISFEVGSGEVFGLLGPNGAGKTTIVGVLTTMIRPTSGLALVAGIDVAKLPVQARAMLGVVPQRNNLDRSLSIRQNLLFHAAYHGVRRSAAARRADQLLEVFGLAERAADKPDRFSRGQAQRVMIARALTHSPAVLFVDEPTTGLDPAARLFVWDRIRELRQQGSTILLTTHDMDEAETLADRVGIVDWGRLLALGTPGELVQGLPGSATLDITVIAPADPHLLVQRLAGIPGVVGAEPLGQAHPMQSGRRTNGQAAGAGSSPLLVRLYVDGDPALLIPAVSSLAGRPSGGLAGVAIGTRSLEDVFLHLTGRALR
ncbi:MAG TPA: ABC transporter ATP-binding protein [Streptosporangiaceae bacterium]|nr:ABC transporter ATP-binding protein [Streptosporangiaceae bacterium]